MRRRRKELQKRMLCAALIVSLLCQNGMDTVFAKQENGAGKPNIQTEETVSDGDLQMPDGTEVTGGDAEPFIMGELAENRGLYSKEYLLSDRSHAVVIYDHPIHYVAEDGTFREIDHSLVKTTDGYRNAAGSFTAVYTDSENSRGQVIYKEDDYEISWQMVEVEEVSSGDVSDGDTSDGNPSDGGVSGGDV